MDGDLKREKKPYNYSRLNYIGMGHECSIRYGLCYWDNLEIAKRECRAWKECMCIYETNSSLPASATNPVFWAFRSGGLLESKGDMVWKKKVL